MLDYSEYKKNVYSSGVAIILALATVLVLRIE